MNIKCNTVAESYEILINKLLYEPEYITAPRGQKIHEIINCSIELIDVVNTLIENKIRSTPLEYLANELVLYFSGEATLDKFSVASKFWNKLFPENYTGYVNSAYGNLLFNNPIKFDYNSVVLPCVSQWHWAKHSLRIDKDSRQAIMHYNMPIHQYPLNGDFVCTLNSQFIIRNNKLHMITTMRSQDAVFGYTFDVVFFTLLMQCMKLELIDLYPDLQLGTYMHNVGSFHIYERNFEMLKESSEYPMYSHGIPLLKENPILHSDILNMNNGIEYTGNDTFFNWLEKNRKK